MSAIQQLLTDHLDIWTADDTEKKSGRGRSSGTAGSVYGIKKLRELILELAVRGKLVPQDENDEPASELLSKIDTGKLKSIKLQLDINDQEKPFELPRGWEWVNFGSVSEIERGGSPRPIKSFFTTDEDGLNWIKIGDTDQGGKYITSTNEKIKKEGLSKTRMVYPGDFLLTNSMSFGRPYITKIEGCIHDGWLRISPPEALDKDYLYNLLSSPYVRSVFIAAAAGAVVMNLNADKVRDLLIPVPPIIEQHRIVAKVDELMALCDQLENQHNNAAVAHEKLVTHLLGTLTQSQNAEDFNINWQRIAAHFDTLFTTEASIDALKQTLLQLAVMGKLVPQDPNDEPASELIKRLRTDRSTWLSENQHNNPECKTMQKKLAALPNAEAPFILPSSWATVHLINCCRLLVDCHNKTAPYSYSGIPIIRTSNIRERKFRMEDLKYVSEDTYKFWSRRCLPEPADIMFTREAPMGEAAIIPLGAKYCLGQRTMLIRPMHEFIFNEYLLITLTEPHLLERSSDSAIGSTVKHLRVGAVEQLNIPLPPLVEQHRIVAKVNELMVICDQLKDRITDANQLQQKLADVVIEQAIN